MKRNKIAAAALALALATPVVANAASTTTTRNSADFGSHGTGNYVITEDFRKYETNFVNAWKEYVAAQEALTKAEANEKAAKEAFDKANADLNAYEANIEKAVDAVNNQLYYLQREWREIQRLSLVANYEKVVNAYTPAISYFTGKLAYVEHNPAKASYSVKLLSLARSQWTPAEVQDSEIAALLTEYNNDAARYDALVDAYEATYSTKRLADLTLKVQEAKKALEVATQARKDAEARESAAKKAYRKAKENFILAGMNRNVIDEAEKRGDLSLVTTTTKTTTTKPVTKEETTETVVETVKPGTTTPAKKGLTAAQKAALEKAIADAEVQIQAVKFLKETTPKTIEGVVGKLDKLVAEQEARLVKAKAILDADKVAISDILFSTAYAAEETEDVDALIKEINDSTEEIKDTLKANEAAQPEVKEEEKKPEVKEEEKKPEDKKEETKVIEKTVVKPASTNKSAGSNAKTGIAGVAGVAGVLAAASVAYAASKKN